VDKLKPRTELDRLVAGDPADVVSATAPSAIGGYADLRTIATYLAVSRATIFRFLSDPDDPIPAHKPGGKLLVKLSAVDAWMARHSVKRTADADFERISRLTERQR
jgi:excisionase family DNA binding protein